MIYEEKKSWLRRYQTALCTQRELELEVQQLQSSAERVTPLLSGARGGGGDGQTLPRAVERLLESKAELEQAVAHCDAVRREVSAVIAALPPGREQEVLRRRYILGQRWEKIAVEMDTDLRWVYRLHSAAVKRLTMESH
ncbi:MAG: hypothetical protein ACI4JC_05360 [Faecalibacterium sp.]